MTRAEGLRLVLQKYLETKDYTKPAYVEGVPNPEALEFYAERRKITARPRHPQGPQVLPKPRQLYQIKH